MEVTQLEVIIHQRERNPDPIGDAIQALPGAGSVQVIALTDDIAFWPLRRLVWSAGEITDCRV